MYLGIRPCALKPHVGGEAGFMLGIILVITVLVASAAILASNTKSRRCPSS